LDDRFTDILGVPVREVRLPVRPGRNMSSIIEIAARIELLRQTGHYPVRDFIDRIDRHLTADVSADDSMRPSVPVPTSWRKADYYESSAPPSVVAPATSREEDK